MIMPSPGLLSPAIMDTKAGMFSSPEGQSVMPLMPGVASRPPLPAGNRYCRACIIF